MSAPLFPLFLEPEGRGVETVDALLPESPTLVVGRVAPGRAMGSSAPGAEERDVARLGT